MSRDVEQLDLFSHQPTRGEMEEEVDPRALFAKLQPLANRYRVDWYEAKARVYLRIMNRIISSTRLPPAVKRHEISRVFKVRQDCLKALEKLQR
jgi:hypothetical protein